MGTAKETPKFTRLGASRAPELLPKQNYSVEFQLPILQKLQEELLSKWLFQLPGACVSNINEGKGDGSRPG